MNLNDLFKTIVLLMLGENCILCKREAVTVHHIDAKGIGYTSLNTSFNPLNGCPICGECHDNIHSRYGERWGKAEIYKRLTYLETTNHKTNPLNGSTKREVAKELNQMLDLLRSGNITT